MDSTSDITLGGNAQADLTPAKVTGIVSTSFMRPRTYRRICPLLCLAFCGQIHSAWALEDSQKSAARQLAIEGTNELEQGHFAEASAKLRLAYDVVRLPTVGVRLARAYREQGRLLAATELLREVLLLEPTELWVGSLQQSAQREAELSLAECQPQVPRLKLAFQGAAASDVSVTVDGGPLHRALISSELFLDPGIHRLVAKTSDGRSEEQSIRLLEGQEHRLVFTFKPSASPAEVPMLGAKPEQRRGASSSASDETSPLRMVAWAGLGVGAAGLLISATTGGWLLAKQSEMKADCPDGTCAGGDSERRRVARYNTVRSVSAISLASGAILAAAGATVLFIAPTTTRKSTTGFFVGADSAGVFGVF